MTPDWARAYAWAKDLNDSLDGENRSYVNYPQVWETTVKTEEILDEVMQPDGWRGVTVEPTHERIDWSLVEHLCWHQLHATSFEVHLHECESATLYRVVAKGEDGSTHEALDWHLEDAVKTLVEGMVR